MYLGSLLYAREEAPPAPLRLFFPCRVRPRNTRRVGISYGFILIQSSAGHPLCLKGVPRWCDRFGKYGIKVSSWGSGTLKFVIYVENYPQKRCFRLADYHPLWGWGGVNQRTNICSYHICTDRGGKQRTSR